MDKSYKSTSWDICNTLLNNVIYIYIYIPSNEGNMCANRKKNTKIHYKFERVN